MLTLPQIKIGLSDRNLKVVSDNVDISLSSIYKIIRGQTPNPTYETLKALSDYLLKPLWEVESDN